MPDFDGRVVVVTGGATGIGAASSKAFAAAGAVTIVLDRNAEAGRELERSIGDSGGMLHFRRVTSPTRRSSARPWPKRCVNMVGSTSFTPTQGSSG